jgi:hypothetical protein
MMGVHWPSRWLYIILVAWGVSLFAQARSFSEGKVHLRVMITSVPVREGPGGSFREIGRIGFGQVFPAIDRSEDGAWYRIRLTRGVSGWVLSELVWPFEIVETNVLSQAFSWYEKYDFRSETSRSKISLSLSGGTLNSDGLFAMRAAFFPSEHYALEITAGESPGTFGNLLFLEAELLIFIGPWRTVVPFIAVGGGVSTTPSSISTTVFESKTRPLLCGGGGISVSWTSDLAIRLDARRIILFSADQSWNAWTFTGGPMLHF